MSRWGKDGGVGLTHLSWKQESGKPDREFESLSFRKIRKSGILSRFFWFLRKRFEKVVEIFWKKISYNLNWSSKLQISPPTKTTFLHHDAPGCCVGETLPFCQSELIGAKHDRGNYHENFCSGPVLRKKCQSYPLINGSKKEEENPEFADYKGRVNIFFPLPPRN